MLQVLVESRAAGQRRSSWTAASFIAHSALLVLAVYVTARPPATLERRNLVEDVIYVPTPASTPPVAASPDRAFDPFAIVPPSIRLPAIPEPVVSVPAANLFDRVIDDIRAMSVGSFPGTRTGAPASSDGIHTAESVDRAVVPLAGNPSPPYPSRLAGAGVEGDVLARFVVDSAGRVEVRSIEIVEASHPLFGEAVARWLTQTRYTPALVNGTRVRQLVQQRVGFTLRR